MIERCQQRKQRRRERDALSEPSASSDAEDFVDPLENSGAAINTTTNEWNLLNNAKVSSDTPVVQPESQARSSGDLDTSYAMVGTSATASSLGFDEVTVSHIPAEVTREAQRNGGPLIQQPRADAENE
jgi:hypothetical protein